jgi:heavy metal sensor kinase
VRRLNIRWRLTLWFGAAMTILLLVRSVWIYLVMDQRLTVAIDDSLNADFDSLESQLRTAAGLDEIQSALERYSNRRRELAIDVRRPNGNSIFHGHSQNVDVSTATAGARGRRKSETKSTSEGPRQRSLSAVIDTALGPLRVEIDRSTDDKRNEVRDFAMMLLATLPLVIGAALGVGYFVSSRALTPVDQMISAAQRITASQLDQRIDVPRSADELSRLAQTLNEMIDRLHRSFDEMRRFTADAAHDLRTPVTALRTEVEVCLMSEHTPAEYRDTLQTVLDEAIHLSRLTRQLLDLSREDHGVRAQAPEPVRLDAVLATAREDLRIASQQKRISIDVEGIGEWTVPGDPVRLRRVFMNLLDNAIQYTPAGGHIRIRGSFNPPWAQISISDDGPGVPMDDLPHIFDRFRRVDKARNREAGGTGLGLAICKAIVESHGGTIGMESQLGQGTTVSVTLPTAGQEAAPKAEASTL